MARYDTHAFVWVRKEVRDELRKLKSYSTEPIGEVVARLASNETTNNDSIKYQKEVETTNGFR